MFFKVTSSVWLFQILITIGIFTVFFAIIFSLLTVKFVIDPIIKQTELANNREIQDLEIAHAKMQLKNKS